MLKKFSDSDQLMTLQSPLITSLADWARWFPGSPPLAKMESSFSEEKGQNEIEVISISNSDSEYVSFKWRNWSQFLLTKIQCKDSTGWRCRRGAFREVCRLSNWTVECVRCKIRLFQMVLCEFVYPPNTTFPLPITHISIILTFLTPSSSVHHNSSYPTVLGITIAKHGRRKARRRYILNVSVDICSCTWINYVL